MFSADPNTRNSSIQFYSGSNDLPDNALDGDSASSRTLPQRTTVNLAKMRIDIGDLVGPNDAVSYARQKSEVEHLKRELTKDGD